MKKNIILLGTLLISGVAFSQVGIDTDTPKATLDIKASPTSTTKIDGLIAPRVTGAELKSNDSKYTTEQDGAIIYVTSAVSSVTDKTTNVTSIGYYYFDKTQGTAGRWMKMANPGSTPGTADQTVDAWIDDPTNSLVKLGTKANGTVRATLADAVINDNGYLGLGTSSPTSRISILGTGGGNDDILIQSVASSSGAGSTTGTIAFNKAKGTTDAKTSVDDGTSLGSIIFGGYNGSSHVYRAGIESIINGDVSGSTIPTDLFFSTGTNDKSERMRITSAGNVGIGTSAPSNKLHVLATSDPVKFEGLQTGATTDQVVTVGTDGVLKKLPITTVAPVAATVTADNGLTKTGNNIQLGGDLIKATTVSALSSTNTLSFRSANANAANAYVTVGTTGGESGGVYFGNTGHGVTRGFPTIGTGNNVGFYTTNGDVYLSSNGAATGEFVLKDNGNVGINTTTPFTRFDVVGSVRGGANQTGTVGTNSAAFGDTNTASGTNSFASGSTNIAGGTNSIAMGAGNSTTIAGVASVSLGNSNTASGSATVAIGNTNTAAGTNSVAIGVQNSTTSDSKRSVSIGSFATTTAAYTTIIGHMTKATTLGETKLGWQPINNDDSQITSITNTNPIIFGVGNSEATVDTQITRQNVFTAFKDGYTVIGNVRPDFIIGSVSQGLTAFTKANDELLKVLGGIYADGNIRAKGSVYRNTSTSIPDYVFQKYYTGSSSLNANYEFTNNLYEVENFLKENHHLPGVMSAKEIYNSETKTYDVDMGALQNQTLEKTEELYLHVIEQQKQIDELKELVKAQQEQINKMWTK